MVTNSYKEFLEFFNRMDSVRLDRLDESYFAGMNDEERRLAFNYLKKAFDNGSDEATQGIKSLCGEKCSDLFKARLRILQKSLDFSEQRLSIALYLWEFTGDSQYQDEMMEFLDIDNEKLKQDALVFLSGTTTTERLVEKLMEVISGDNNGTILFVAGEQLLGRFGIKDEEDTKEIYKDKILKLISDEKEVRLEALNWLNKYKERKDL